MSTLTQCSHFFTTDSLVETESSAGGSIRMLTSNEVPGLTNLSHVDLTLQKNGVMKPIWHPNAQKIGYCTQGKLLVSIRAPGQSEQFTVEKGEIFYVPQGCIHHIENMLDTDGVIKFALNHGDPQTMCLSRSVHATSDAAFDLTFVPDSSFVKGLKASESHELIGTLSGSNHASASSAHRYKFDIEKSDMAVQDKGGFFQVGLKVNLNALEGVAILGFGLNPGGAIEPHWHPNSDELVYITKGRIRGMLHSPDGNVETQEVGPGEGFYAPASYFHSVETSGDEKVEGIAFFNNPEMVYLGLGEALGAFSDEVLASTFNVDPDYFKSFSKPENPLIIVPV
ncbi:MAG: cupin domain-containing protein [Planctomycetota bacterium]|nr:cupin domain-containing protein [Planctomycetota bacterium]